MESYGKLKVPALFASQKFQAQRDPKIKLFCPGPVQLRDGQADAFCFTRTWSMPGWVCFSYTMAAFGVLTSLTIVFSSIGYEESQPIHTYSILHHARPGMQ